MRTRLSNISRRAAGLSLVFDRSIRDAETIERFGTVRMHRRGTMGAHSHRVAIYADQIATLIDWRGDRASLLRWALWHDMDEVITGDLPGPVKRKAIEPGKYRTFIAEEMARRFPGGEYMSPGNRNAETIEIEMVVKIADMVDELLTLECDIRMGNSDLDSIVKNTSARLFGYIKKSAMSQDRATVLCRAIVDAVARHGLYAPPRVLG